MTVIKKFESFSTSSERNRQDQDLNQIVNIAQDDNIVIDVYSFPIRFSEDNPRIGGIKDPGPISFLTLKLHRNNPKDNVIVYPDDNIGAECDYETFINDVENIYRRVEALGFFNKSSIELTIWGHHGNINSEDFLEPSSLQEAMQILNSVEEEKRNNVTEILLTFHDTLKFKRDTYELTSIESFKII